MYEPSTIKIKPGLVKEYLINQDEMSRNGTLLARSHGVCLHQAEVVT